MQLAFARAGMRWEDAAIVSVHGRSLAGVVARLRARAKAALLTDEERSPPRIAAHLLAHGDAGWRAWVCERLGGPGERVRAFGLADLAVATDIDPLNVLLLARTDPAWLRVYYICENGVIFVEDNVPGIVLGDKQAPLLT
jgi:precorrin-6Y C5,15-methyltransferase (decarboxylating)